ncbi:hypothetical protein EV426DRAFT_576193 [Tirmania nivea]|nr:hypothetical protein EV426DRAFT_576193 [Tirmania nivea]
MCYVHPIYPTLCNHHYYLLLAICGPNASLRTCPSSHLIITGPPGWDGCPKRVENGLCPRCDLVNEGVDLSRIRFYKPEKASRRTKRRKKNEGHKSPVVAVLRWSSDGNGLARARGGNHHVAMRPAFPSPTSRKIYPYSHSVQSLPSPRTVASSRIYDDDSDYSSGSSESSPNQKHRARRWLTFHAHRNRHTTTQTIQTHMPGGVIKDGDTPGDDGGRCRGRLKTMLKKSLSPLKGMVEGIEHKFVHVSRSRPNQQPATSGVVGAWGMDMTTGAP